MENTNLENLNRLAKLFGTDRLISPEEIQEIRGVLVGVLANNKKELESLTAETRELVNKVLNKVLDEHDTYLEKSKQIVQEAKSDTTEAIQATMKSLEEVKKLCKEVMDCKPENGKDADEEYVIGEVLNRIKLPEYKEIVLDDGTEIVSKINDLPVNEDNQIDAKHIKNLPEFKNGRWSGITKGAVIKLIQESGSAGVTLKVGGTNNVDQGTLDLIAGSGITIVDNGDGTVTFTSTGGSGSGDVTGPASSTDNAIARFDGTTGKIVQNSAATIADTTGNITAGTYNGNTIGAGSTSGTNTGDQTTITGNAGTATVLQTARTIGTITGDATSAGSSFDGSANNTNALTLATVNSNVGSFGSATASPAITVNAKGLVTAVSTNTITPAVGSITGLGTGVGTFLATPSSANLATAVTDETGSGSLVFGTSPTLATPVINGATLNGDLQIDGTPNTDDTWNGKSTNSFNAGATIAQFDCVYMSSSSTWLLTDADAIGTAGNVLIMMAGAAGTNGDPLRVIEPGSWVRNDAWNWTVGGTLYLDTTTPGGMTQTAPSGADDVVKVVGYAVSADVIYFAPSVNWIIHT